MLFNQFFIFIVIFFNICVLILLWIKWQKLGGIVLSLLIINLVIISFGAGRILIFGSMRFDSFNHDISSKVVNLNDNSKSISTGKAILNTLKSLNKKLRGKEPVYITNDGYQISVDSFGKEKSININKPFW